jgi:hypothetical protein
MKFNFSKKAANIIKEVVAPVNTAEVIEAIHNEFDTAADRALEQAMFILSQGGVDSLKKEKATLMEKFGFTGTKQVQEVRDRDFIDSNAKMRADIVAKYKNKYPQYKFIFREQVNEICEKYGLICGEASMYKGDIPLKNLKEIEAFEVSDEDRYKLWNHFSSWSTPTSAVLRAGGGSNVISLAEEKRKEEQEKTEISLGNIHISMDRGYGTPIPFFICAPKKDMNLEGYKLDGVFVKKEWPDPIVLHYVKDGFLIVTKWGIEGDDPMLQK